MKQLTKEHLTQKFINKMKITTSDLTDNHPKIGQAGYRQMKAQKGVISCI